MLVNVSLKIVHSQHIEMNDRLTFSQTWDEWSRRMLPKLGREFLQWCRQFQGKDSSHLSMMLCLKSLSSRHQMKSQENLCALFSSQRSNLKRNCMIKGKPSAKNNKCKVFWNRMELLILVVNWPLLFNNYNKKIIIILEDV